MAELDMSRKNAELALLAREENEKAQILQGIINIYTQNFEIQKTSSNSFKIDFLKPFLIFTLILLRNGVFEILKWLTSS